MKNILNAVYALSTSVEFNRFMVGLTKIGKIFANIIAMFIISVFTYRVLEGQIDGSYLLIVLGWSGLLIGGYSMMERMAKDDLAHAISKKQQSKKAL